MSEVASRLYSSAAAAEDAANALRKVGYRPNELAVLSRPDGDEGGAHDAVLAQARGAGVFKSRAAELADGVVKGATAVICRPRFGESYAVHDMLDAREPLDPGNTSGRSTASSVDAAPLSELLGLPVLGGRGDFFSNLFGLSAVSRNSRSKTKLMGQTGPYKPIIPLPTLSGGRGAYKPVIPMPTLSGGSGSYKPVIPLPTLSGGRGAYKPIVPMPLLTGKSD
jgi:hypothetical protein